MFVLIYVDNIIITGNDPNSLQKFVNKLPSLFALKDMGDLHNFLGIEVTRNETGVYLTQTRYIEELLQKTEMLNTRPCPTPAVVGNKLIGLDGELMTNPTHYRSIIGALQYLTHTRPDIAFIINKLSQSLKAPTTIH
ncbi:hypothetical protein UlMin_041447 [Ulmus minor]